jgi:DNA-binding transcriptional LysR family regulator
MAWDDLRVLLALHRHRGLARAARALAVDATTIGRKLRALERTTGVRLARRVADGHALTPAGEAMIPAIERIERETLGLERALRTTAAAAVRVTAGDGLSNHVLAPALPALRRGHPALTIDLIPELRVLDLARREADIAVRLVDPGHPNLVATPLPPLAMALYASRDYLAARGAPTRLADLAAHDWIGYVQDVSRVRAAAWLTAHVPASRVAMRSTSTTTLVEACAAGVGLFLVLRCIAARDPRLVPVLPRARIPARDGFLLIHEDDRRNPRITAVAGWLRATLTRAARSR